MQFKENEPENMDLEEGKGSFDERNEWNSQQESYLAQLVLTYGPHNWSIISESMDFTFW